MSKYKFELWRDIPGYEGLYQISCFGRVKSLSRKIYNHKNKSAYYLSREKIKKPAIHKQGYLCIHLSRDGQIKKYYIARLVADTFLDKVVNKSEVNHKDLNKQNNFYYNLEWVTPKENVQHSFRVGNRTGLKGELNPKAILTWERVRAARKAYKEGRKYTDICKDFNISSGNLSHIISYKTWNEGR